MPIEIRVPRLGWSMEEGTFAGWLKHEGELIKKGDLLFALEGDKSTQEVESFEEGILEFLPDGPNPGDLVLVGQLIGVLHGSNVAIPPSSPTSSVERATAAVPPPPSPRPTPAAAPFASPRARRAARELGVDWTTLTGTGSSGRIRERDVRAAAFKIPRPQPRPRPRAERDRTSGGIRRLIADRMMESCLSTAPVTLTTTADATRLVGLREEFKAAGATPLPSYADFIAKFVALALREHPAFNSSWNDGAIAIHDEVNIGVAVDTPAGLIVPVIRDVDVLGLRELAATSRATVDAGKAGKLGPDAFQGGTFTITNLGAEGIDVFTPIINPPQAAILGLGRIKKEPVWDGSSFVPRDVITLSLTFDHRIADGAPAARFLRSIVRSIENPSERLIP